MTEDRKLEVIYLGQKLLERPLAWEEKNRISWGENLEKKLFGGDYILGRRS